MEKKHILKGGSFLTTLDDSTKVFIPEDFDEEQKMIAQTCQDFMDTEIFPMVERIDAMEPGLMPSLLKKAGELGLLGISIPEEYGGFGQSFVTSMIASDVIGAGYSYAVAYSAHTGIGSLPIVYYGNEEQKAKYLPKLASGEWLGAYCLTEPNAGSDANSGKTRAVLSEEGKYYILNGQKMWITNGGFADVLTVFAKIDNDKILSAFIVERTFPGIRFNVEEKKMGIKGSSTVQIFFEDCKVPVENLLGKRGEGFRIALNILHIGRIKLGGNVLGAAKRATTQSVNYALERKQFGTEIANFGAIKFKLAEQVIRTFVAESAVYRTSKLIDEKIASGMELGLTKGQAILEALGEFAAEAAILKVLGSEALDYVVDEAVQVFGGMGFSAEMPVDRAYRDSRINRIFEGTNEINRMVIVDQMTKTAKKAESVVFELGNAILQEPSSTVDLKGDAFSNQFAVVENFKKAVLMVFTAFHNTLGKQYSSEQEIMTNLADMFIQLFAAESVLLRADKLQTKGHNHLSLIKDIVNIYIYDAGARIAKAGTDAINSFAEGEENERLQNKLKELCKPIPVNVRDARRRIANKLIEENRYFL